MKIRRGFISNSSSTAFVIAADDLEKGMVYKLADMYDFEIRGDALIFRYSGKTQNTVLEELANIGIPESVVKFTNIE